MPDTFAALGLSEPIVRAVSARDYRTPTPIQKKAIPHLLEGRDLLGIAQTGTGKTAAFTLPLLQRLVEAQQRAYARRPRSLVLTPTRELALQVGESVRAYGAGVRVRAAVIYGGVGQRPQVEQLRRGVAVLVATPGRLLDLLQQGHVALSKVEILVLDEADRMLDMGFVHDVRRIIKELPRERQSLLFSATMPPDVVALTRAILRDPVRVEVAPPATTVERVEQSVYLVEKPDKRPLLTHVLGDPRMLRTLVFTRTKHGADRVARHLQRHGIGAVALHGDKSQGARVRALEAFRSGEMRVLVATDIAARGIDVKDVTHVVNFDLPHVAETYVHRIGRTARASRSGVALSFCDTAERPLLRAIEKVTRQRLAVVADHPHKSGQS